MKTRTLSRGITEAYNERIRIRLQISPDLASALITVFYLKPNGYHYHRKSISVHYPVKLEDVIKTYQTLTRAA